MDDYRVQVRWIEGDLSDLNNQNWTMSIQRRHDWTRKRWFRADETGTQWDNVTETKVASREGAWERITKQGRKYLGEGMSYTYDYPIFEVYAKSFEDVQIVAKRLLDDHLKAVKLSETYGKFEVYP